MAKIRHPVRDRLEKAAFDALRGAVRLLDVEEADRFGRLLGRVAAPFFESRLRLARTNLSRAFPELGPAGAARLARDVVAHFGGLLVELVRAGDEPLDALLARVEVVNGEAARRAHGSGRGLLFITPHLGSWEYAALATGSLGIPATVIARPLDNALLDPVLTEFRERGGNRVQPKADAAREILRVLRRGGAIGILPDQHARPPDAVVVPFFGRPASTTSAVARLADRTEALILSAYAVRTGPARWRMVYEEPLDVRTLSPSERTPEALTARINAIVESQVRRHPEQWLWLHNRWRLD